VEDGAIRLHVEISDTGVGIPPEAWTDFLQPFGQGDTTTVRRHGETGLGLAISRASVDLMGGEIGQCREPGQGSAVWFTCCLATAQNTPSSRHLAPGTPKRILVAEDNVINQRVASLSLRKHGHILDIAETGTEAVASMRQNDYDRILMDIQMPDMDGIEATARIRAMEDPGKANIPIIAMTAQILDRSREEYLALGMNDYIAKPIRPDRLAALIARAIDRFDHSAPLHRQPQEPQMQTPPMQVATAMLDMPALRDLAEVAGAEVTRSLVRSYLDNARQRQSKIQELLAKSDLTAIIREAHDLISTSGTFGLPGIEALGREIEARSLAGDLAAVQRLTVDLARHAEEAWSRLEQWAEALSEKGG
jgi:CheY-like chemotaxis protein/HPt (histidine-containing phosphotransfer) domain-containing protein